MDVLNQAIEQKRRSSKRLRPCSSFDTDTIGQKKHKNLKEVLRRLTERVQLLQEEHTQLGLRDENMATAELDDAEQKVLLEEKLADLQKEAVLVEDDNEVSLHSVKDISEPENFAASVEEDIDQVGVYVLSLSPMISIIKFVSFRRDVLSEVSTHKSIRSGLDYCHYFVHLHPQQASDR